MNYKIIMLLISFAILAVVIYYFNPLAMANLLVNANPLPIAAAFVLSFIALCLGVLKWKILLKKISYRELFPVQVLGFTISNFTPGKAAEPAKAVILKMRAEIPISTSLASIIWERIMDVIVLLLFSTLALSSISMTSNLFLPSVLGVSIFVFLVCISLLVLYKKSWGNALFVVVRRLPLFKRLPDNFMDLFYKNSIDRTSIAKSLFVTLIAWVIVGSVLYSILAAFGVYISPVFAVGVVALSVVVGIASSLPGGLGTTELVMIFLLGVAGVDSTTAAAATLLYRLATIWFVDLLGGLSFVYLSRKIDIKRIFR